MWWSCFLMLLCTLATPHCMYQHFEDSEVWQVPSQVWRRFWMHLTWHLCQLLLIGAPFCCDRTELNTLQKVHHPHAVQFLGAATHSQPYMIVTEFLPGGSLTDLFKRVHSGAAAPPSLRRATEMALDCARGMQYLHARKCAAPIQASESSVYRIVSDAVRP